MTSRTLENSHCAKCGVEFRCGVVAGEKACWCMALPVLASAPGEKPVTAEACYCAACLKFLLAEAAA